MLFDTNKKNNRSFLACFLLFASLVSTVSVHSRQPTPPVSLATIALAELPPQGRLTYRLVHEGGPFAYDKDGVVFGNRERLLPARQRGYYREYTVKTVGASNRGARRIVCGGPKPTAPEACFYTSDHYASFRRIVE